MKNAYIVFLRQLSDEDYDNVFKIMNEEYYEYQQREKQKQVNEEKQKEKELEQLKKLKEKYE